jgi:hypothetical protein
VCREEKTELSRIFDPFDYSSIRMPYVRILLQVPYMLFFIVLCSLVFPRLVHRMMQHPPPSPFSNVSRAALVAASNTSSTPSPVRDEHSRYFRAPISCPISVASRVVTKCWDFLRISSMATGSSRRSFLRPTRMIGTFGHRSLASSTHCYEVSSCLA